MEDRGETEPLLHHALIRILPAENRYEAFICVSEEVEKLHTGQLERLLPHISSLNDLFSKGYNANFKLQVNEEFSTASWFTKSTLNRFLLLVESPEFLDTIKAIEAEMSQLEQARNFHLSLYLQGQKDNWVSGEQGLCNRTDGGSTVHPEGKAVPEDSSKNELLRAIDLRLTALRSDLSAALEQATGALSSSREVIDLANFCDHFGAGELKNILCKFVKQSQEQDMAVSQNSRSNSGPGMSKAEMNHYKVGAAEKRGSACTISPVKYGASPAIVAQVERHSSTDSEESSCSSDEDENLVEPLERGRANTVSAKARRSASPMRKIQMARTNSRKAPALTIKSRNYYSGRERLSLSGDRAAIGGKEEGSEEKISCKMRMMTVQDAINIFENKQKGQNKDGEKTNSLSNVSVCSEKPVLRRWSGTGESSTPSQVDLTSEDTGMQCHTALPYSVQTDNEALVKRPKKQYLDQGGTICRGSIEDSDTEIGVCGENTDPVDPQMGYLSSEEHKSYGRLLASSEWIKEKEVEFNQMVKMLEIQDQKSRTTPRRNQTICSTQKGKPNDQYKEKKDRKLPREHILKRADYETPHVNMKERLPSRKVGTSSTNAKEIVGKEIASKKYQELLENSPDYTSLRSVARKASAIKKASSKTTNLAPSRKSWPSTSSSMPAGLRPSRISSTGAGAGTKPARQKSLAMPSPPAQLSGKVDRHRSNLRNVNESRSFGSSSIKSTKEIQKTLKRSEKEQKEKVLAVGGDSSGMVHPKPSFLGKMNSKSTVVPIESRTLIQKRSGACNGAGPAAKKKQISHQLEKHAKRQGSTVGTNVDRAIADASVSASTSDQQKIVPDMGSALPRENLEDRGQVGDKTENLDELVPEIGSDLSTENLENRGQVCDKIENLNELVPDIGSGLSTENLESGGQVCDKTENLNELATGNVDAMKVEPFSAEVSLEDESGISPTAWVEKEVDGEQNLRHSKDNGNKDRPSSLVHIANTGSSTSRVRQSLSEMLREDASEPETPEWGNAENPPPMFCQTDVSKGLKRLLKFSRRSRETQT